MPGDTQWSVVSYFVGQIVQMGHDKLSGFIAGQLLAHIYEESAISRPLFVSTRLNQ